MTKSENAKRGLPASRAPISGRESGSESAVWSKPDMRNKEPQRQETTDESTATDEAKRIKEILKVSDDRGTPEATARTPLTERDIKSVAGALRIRLARNVGDTINLRNVAELVAENGIGIRPQWAGRALSKLADGPRYGVVVKRANTDTVQASWTARRVDKGGGQ